MMAAKLPLRDVHLSAAPGWWPLPPGWWLVIAVVLVVIAVGAVLAWRRKRRRQRWMELFDVQMRQATSEPARLAGASELLRRAARQCDPHATQLQGEAWLDFLDGPKGSAFRQGEGRVLLEGGFRPQVEHEAVERACALARARFLELMAGKR